MPARLSTFGRVSWLYCGLVRERGILRTSMTIVTPQLYSKRTKSSRGRVEWPTVKTIRFDLLLRGPLVTGRCFAPLPGRFGSAMLGLVTCRMLFQSSDGIKNDPGKADNKDRCPQGAKSDSHADGGSQPDGRCRGK